MVLWRIELEQRSNIVYSGANIVDFLSVWRCIMPDSETCRIKRNEREKDNNSVKSKSSTQYETRRYHSRHMMIQNNSDYMHELQHDNCMDRVQEVENGTARQQVIALLNVYTDQASEKDKSITQAILHFIKRLWLEIKSFFNKKSKQEDCQTNKSEVLSKIVELFHCSDTLQDVASDSKLMHRIISELPIAERNIALDNLYEHVTDPKLLMTMIEVRFGVTVIDSRPETMNSLDQFTKRTANSRTHLDWTSVALVEVYKIYTHLPQSDLDLIACLMHTSDNAFGGGAYRKPNGTTGVYYVNYIRGKELEREIVDPTQDGQTVFGHSDLITDRRNNTIKLNMTIAHELGHIVDGNSGWKLSGAGSSMRNISKWEEFSNDPDVVVNAMTNSLTGKVPYAGKLDQDEIEIAKDVGRTFLNSDNNSKKWNETMKTIRKITSHKVNDYNQKNNAQLDAPALSNLFLDTTQKCNLLYHLWLGRAENESFYNHQEAMRDMDRPFHQGYKNQEWFTFDKSAWYDKISCYQFRCPKEEFAETYASYHVAPAMGKKKGDMTPKGLLNWFISQGLGDVVPDNIANHTSDTPLNNSDHS